MFYLTLFCHSVIKFRLNQIIEVCISSYHFSFPFFSIITFALITLSHKQSHLIKQMPKTRINLGFRHFNPLFQLNNSYAAFALAENAESKTFDGFMSSKE